MLLVSFASQNGVLLVYCYAIGIFSSRRIERATYRDVGVRYLTADMHPDHDTIAKFRREKLQAKLEAARERLEAQARAKAESEKAAYVGKVEAREARQGRNKGPKINPPKEHPRAEQQVNLVDGDSRLMRKNKRSGFDQCYNAQATVDAEGKRSETRKAPKAESVKSVPSVVVPVKR